MANCGRCIFHFSYTDMINGETFPDGCICDSTVEHAQKFHKSCHLGDGNPKPPNHNCPYFEALPDDAQSHKIQVL